MKTRLIARASVLVIALLGFCTSIALAGGWAVVTVDDLPTQTIAGKALTLGFIVRQHGLTLRDDLQPLLRFARADTTESLTVIAHRQGGSGHYTADVTFPSAGQWNWRVDLDQAGMITQNMPPINVTASSIATAVSAAPNSLPVAAEMLGLVGVGAAGVLWLRTRARWTLALAGFALVIGLGGLIAAGSNPVLATASAQPDRPELADRGKALFQAKGCVMCHTNTAVQAGAGPFYFGDKPAPDLTRVTLSDEYLRRWLANPAALKPGTAMPNLKLQPDEIEALIAFLKSEHVQ